MSAPVVTTFEDILYERRNSAAVITINRPQRYNAFRAQTVEELIKAFKMAWADNAVSSPPRGRSPPHRCSPAPAVPGGVRSTSPRWTACSPWRRNPPP